jgi:sulfur relay (sulfurtransferase) DsrF/TusC family protein
MALWKSETDLQEMYETAIYLLSWYYCTQIYCYETMLEERMISHQTQVISSDYKSWYQVYLHMYT